MYKNFHNKYRDYHVSQRYELQKYEYYRDLEFDFLKYDTEKVNEGIIHIPDGGIEAYCKDNNIPITRFNVDDQLFDHLHNSFMPAGEIIADKKGNSGKRKFIAAFEKALKEYEKRHPEIS